MGQDLSFQCRSVGPSWRKGHFHRVHTLRVTFIQLNACISVRDADDDELLYNYFTLRLYVRELDSRYRIH